MIANQSLISGNRSGNNDSFNTYKYIAHNYSKLATSHVPETFEELLTQNRPGVSLPEIDLDYLRDRHDMPEDGTGEWIFEEPWYREWQASEASQLLWLCGGPGTGKTMLAKRVAAKFLLEPGDPPSGVKLGYHSASPEPRTDKASTDDADSRKRRLAKVAWDLLYGILQQDGRLFGGCKTELKTQGDKFFTNPNSLWNVLKKAIQDCRTNSVYILIDGVDGLDEDLCMELIGRIVELMNIRSVKIFLSSRDVPHISNTLSKRTKINIDTNDSVKGDLETFITRRIKAFGGWNEEQKLAAIETLLEKSEGTFLWASLVLENLRRSSPGTNCQAFLRNLPSELKDIYGRMLRDIRSQGGYEEVLKMIRSVALALRPVTFAELIHILTYTEEGKAGTRQQRSRRGTGMEEAEARTRQQRSRQGTGTEVRRITEEEIIEQHVQSSRSFLCARAKTISLVHHTAVEYLFDESLQDTQRLPARSELDFAVSWGCFRHLHEAIEGLEKSPRGSGTGRQGRSRESSSRRDHREMLAETPQAVAQKRQKAEEKWPYLKYAAESWFIHARRSIEAGEDKFRDDSHHWLDYGFFGTNGIIRKEWIGYCGDPKMEILAGEQTPLNVAVCLGLTPLVKALLNSNTRKEDSSTHLSLHLAAKFPSGAYKILVAESSPSFLIVRGQYSNTLLHEAAISGHLNMQKALVEKFAGLEDGAYSDQINKKNRFGDTPLHLAVQFDHPDIVEALVKKGADRTIRNGRGVTASELSATLRRDDSFDILRLAEVGALEKLAEEAVVAPVLPRTEEPIQELVAPPAKEPGGKLRWRVRWNLWCLGVSCSGEWEAKGDDNGGDGGGHVGQSPRRAREECPRGAHGRGQGRTRKHQLPMRRGRYQTAANGLLTAGPGGHHGSRSPRRTDAYSTRKEEEGKGYSVVLVR